MGYVVMGRGRGDLAWVLDPKGTWSSRLASNPLKPPPPPENTIKVFALKSTAEREAEKLRAGEYKVGPPPTDTFEVVRVEDGMPDPKEDGASLEFNFGIVKAVRYKNRPHEPWNVYLPHSCDEWEIGPNVEDVQEMIDQLEKAKRLMVEDLG